MLPIRITLRNNSFSMVHVLNLGKKLMFLWYIFTKEVISLHKVVLKAHKSSPGINFVHFSHFIINVYKDQQYYDNYLQFILFNIVFS